LKFSNRLFRIEVSFAREQTMIFIFGETECMRCNW